MSALINGKEFTFTDLKFSMLGNGQVAGVTSLTYEVSQKNDNVYGAGKEPIGFTTGRYTYTGEIKLTMKEVKNIRAALGGLPLTSCPPFTIVVTYSNGLDKDTTDSLFFVRFTKDAGGSSGEDVLEVTIPLAIGGMSLG